MDCIFCKIINKEIKADILYEDNDMIAFSDINPIAKIHVLLVPKKHITSLAQATEANSDLVAKLVLASKKIARKLNIDKSGYRLVTNVGSDAGQVVQHLHWHLIGGESLGPIA
jgi:histidine triad (HIT) family protein